MKRTDSIFINRLTLQAGVGIHAAEKKKRQTINIRFRAFFRRGVTKTISDVVSYETAVVDIRKIAARRHYDLLESLADAIMAHFFKNRKVLRIDIDIDKPDLQKMAPEVFGDTAGVGFSSSRER